MQEEVQQTVEVESEDTTRFIPFRNRKTYWGDSSMRPLIPNVATIIPPDVNPQLLPLLLYRMKLEELAYKSKNLDTQAVNAAWIENKIDLYLFPNPSDALLSKAYECLRYEKHCLMKEIDKALPPVLPPPIILPPNLELPILRPIKRNFPINTAQDQDESIQNQSDEYQYSEEDQQKEEGDFSEVEENKDFESNTKNEYYSQQSISNEQLEEDNTDDNKQFLNNTYPTYNQPYNNEISKDPLKLPPTPLYDEERSRQQPRGYLENKYGNTQSPPPLPYQKQYTTPSLYSNQSYRYGQPNYENYDSTPKQQIPPPLPSYIPNYDRNKPIKIPPPPFLPPPKPQQRPPPPPPPRDFTPLPPPPPLIRNTLAQNNASSPENASGNQVGNQRSKYGNY